MTASAFLLALIVAVRYRIHTILTDNGIQFQYAPRYADGLNLTPLRTLQPRVSRLLYGRRRLMHPFRSSLAMVEGLAYMVNFGNVAGSQFGNVAGSQ